MPLKSSARNGGIEAFIELMDQAAAQAGWSWGVMMGMWMDGDQKSPGVTGLGRVRTGISAEKSNEGSKERAPPNPAQQKIVCRSEKRDKGGRLDQLRLLP
jgi:hypothetical protein